MELNIKIGDILENKDIVAIFKCANMGGIRYSKSTNTLVLIFDHTKGVYSDRWVNGVLHYTGTGKIGDQDIDQHQNKRLANSRTDILDIHLFEVIEPKKYIYRGIVELIADPYIDLQKDDNGNMRKVWIFPIKPKENM